MGTSACEASVLSFLTHKHCSLHSRIDALRPVVEERMQGRASTTTAVPGMLEVSYDCGAVH